jgi:hypothetical protein
VLYVSASSFDAAFEAVFRNAFHEDQLANQLRSIWSFNARRFLLAPSGLPFRDMATIRRNMAKSRMTTSAQRKTRGASALRHGSISPQTPETTTTRRTDRRTIINYRKDGHYE